MIAKTMHNVVPYIDIHIYIYISDSKFCVGE